MNDKNEMNSTANERISLDAIHSMVYEILCDIDECCRKHGITYFLSGGTLLGAVRHKGFIPWDDDGDIMLPRDDYERFLVEFNREYGNKYGIGSLKTDPDWTVPYGIIWDKSTKVRSTILQGKATGIGVDVFPIDGFSESRTARKIFFWRMKVLNGMRNSCLRTGFLEGEKFIILKKAASLVLKPIGARKFAEKMDRLTSKIKIGETGKVGSSVAIHYGDRETLDLKSISETVYMPFEDKNFACPIGYDQYLSNIYGDYMTIPESVREKGATHLDHWSVEISE